MLIVQFHPAMPKRKLWLSIMVRIIVCVVLLGAALAIFTRLRSTAPKPVIADHAEARVRVLVMEVNPTPVRRQWEGFGSAVPVRAADVPSRVTAVVIERPDAIRAGRTVTKGDLLVKLDDGDFARQVEAASQSIEDLEAQLARLDVERAAWASRLQVSEQELQIARADFERAKSALANDAARQREVDQKQQAMLTAERAAIAAREELEKVPLRRASLEAQRARDQATLAQARQNAERCRIVAPIDGVLADVDVDDGESVIAGQRVARIVDLQRIEVPLLLPSSARPTVRVGDDVTLESEAGNPPLRWKAQIARISPNDDESTRTLRVFAEVLQDPNEPGILAPGMFVQGRVTAAEQRPRTIVPRRAINSQRIMLVDEGRIRSRGVDVEFHLQGAQPESGLLDTQWAVLRDPLPPGTLVVVDGARSLADGAPVEAMPSHDSSRLTRDGGASGGQASGGG